MIIFKHLHWIWCIDMSGHR